MPLLNLIKGKPTESPGDKQNIPQELPALSQDRKAEVAQAATAPDSIPGDIPDELPSLDFSQSPQTPQEPRAIAQPQPTARAYQQPAESSPSRTNISVPKAEPRLNLFESEPDSADRQISRENGKSWFFSDAVKKIEGSGKGNIISDMRDYWQSEPVIREEIKTTTQQELETALNDKIRQLQELEQNWLSYRKDMRQAEVHMKRVEAEIAVNADELKTLTHKLEKLKAVCESIQ